MSKTKVSVIIPAYNEGPTFEKSVTKIISVLSKQKFLWEIIFVEDKSLDDTRLKVEKIVGENPHIRAIFHKSNLGRGRSVSDGIIACKGDICGYLDVDLEVSADYLPLFIEEIEEGFDMVVGKRFYDKGSIIRFLSSKVYSIIVKIALRLPVSDTETGFKFFKKSAILPVLSSVKDSRWFWDTEICARANESGLKITEVPVLFTRRHDKKSTVRLVPDTIDYLTAIIKYKLNEKK